MSNPMRASAASLVAAALFGAAVTYVALDGSPREVSAAQVPPGQATQTVLMERTLEDVLGRVVALREFERAPGTGGTPHRHPGSHTFDGPLQRLGPGEVFYEQPGALHAVSRNGSATERVRYLVITVSDPTLPATVPE
jgi:quercetin dioxygenase-like cupin family protein